MKRSGALHDASWIPTGQHRPAQSVRKPFVWGATWGNTESKGLAFAGCLRGEESEDQARNALEEKRPSRSLTDSGLSRIIGGCSRGFGCGQSLVRRCGRDTPRKTAFRIVPAVFLGVQDLPVVHVHRDRLDLGVVLSGLARCFTVWLPLSAPRLSSRDIMRPGPLVKCPAGDSTDSDLGACLADQAGRRTTSASPTCA